MASRKGGGRQAEDGNEEGGVPVEPRLKGEEEGEPTITELRGIPRQALDIARVLRAKAAPFLDAFWKLRLAGPAPRSLRVVDLASPSSLFPVVSCGIGSRCGAPPRFTALPRSP